MDRKVEESLRKERLLRVPLHPPVTLCLGSLLLFGYFGLLTWNSFSRNPSDFFLGFLFSLPTLAFFFLFQVSLTRLILSKKSGLFLTPSGIELKLPLLFSLIEKEMAWKEVRNLRQRSDGIVVEGFGQEMVIDVSLFLESPGRLETHLREAWEGRCLWLRPPSFAGKGETFQEGILPAPWREWLLAISSELKSFRRGRVAEYTGHLGESLRGVHKVEWGLILFWGALALYSLFSSSGRKPTSSFLLLLLGLILFSFLSCLTMGRLLSWVGWKMTSPWRAKASRNEDGRDLCRHCGGGLDSGEWVTTCPSCGAENMVPSLEEEGGVRTPEDLYWSVRRECEGILEGGAIIAERAVHFLRLLTVTQILWLHIPLLVAWEYKNRSLLPITLLCAVMGVSQIVTLSLGIKGLNKQEESAFPDP